jgi:CubicO group peptidase (beta-lactamase class C family)
LPAGVKVPERSGKVITLQDLSTHTSGLPRLPNNFNPKDPSNPYADYSVEQMYQFLSGYTLPRDPGAQYEYSNLGGGLLGHVLARRAGMDYEALLRARITGPLGLTNTRITLSDEMKARLAVGHNEKLAPVPGWDLPTLAGAGAIRSSANDLLTFLSAYLGYKNSPMAPAMSRMLTVRRPTPTPDMEIALGWHIIKSRGNDLIWHNGGTGGYRTFAGYDPKTRVGVVVLANASTIVGVDDIGRHLLDPATPVLPPNAPILQPPKERTEITLDPKVLDRYVGRYQFTPDAVLTMTRDAARFYVQLTGQPAYEVFAESERSFFYKVVDAQFTFDVDADGKATSLLFTQLGRIQRATRFESEPQQMWFGRKPMAIEAAAFDRYVGRYQLTPAVVVTISREDTHLFGMLTGQPKLEIFPENDKSVFLKVVDASMTFEVDAQARPVAVILHQNGRDQRAPRIE